MNKKIILKIFIRFLKENNAYAEYIESLIKTIKDEDNYYHDEEIYAYPDFFNNIKYDGYISTAFTYSNTYQGFDFWKEINYKWLQLLDEYRTIT